jgi:integrase
MPKFPGHPLFDASGYIDQMDDLSDHPSVKAFLDSIDLPSEKVFRDFEVARKFLVSYDQVSGTFGRYRTEIQRFLNYLWLTGKRTLDQIDGDTLQSYLNFVESPPASWISKSVTPAFVSAGGYRVAQSDWRPFVHRVSKNSTGKPAKYQVSPATAKAIRGSLRLFFLHLIELDILDRNPFAHIRKSARSRTSSVKTSDRTVSTTKNVRRLHDWEWEHLVQVAIEAAVDNKGKYERMLFVVVTMKALYLRVSELAARVDSNGAPREPTFGDFKRLQEKGLDCWVFTIYGKGGKLREVTLPDAYLPYLKRWRSFLGLSTDLPIEGEQTPILPSSHGGNLKSRSVATIYESAVLLAADELDAQAKAESDPGTANKLRSSAQRFRALKSTTHYLRHTGASQAIDANPDDLRYISEELGHASAAFTEKEYINSDQAQRRQSGRERKI